MPKLVHYRNKCIGCGVCCEIQATHWRMSRKDGKATLLKSQSKNKVYVKEITEAEVEKSLAVAQACPVRVIKVH